MQYSCSKCGRLVDRRSRSVSLWHHARGEPNVLTIGTIGRKDRFNCREAACPIRASVEEDDRSLENEIQIELSRLARMRRTVGRLSIAFGLLYFLVHLASKLIVAATAPQEGMMTLSIFTGSANLIGSLTFFGFVGFGFAWIYCWFMSIFSEYQMRQ